MTSGRGFESYTIEPNSVPSYPQRDSNPGRQGENPNLCTQTSVLKKKRRHQRDLDRRGESPPEVGSPHLIPCEKLNRDPVTLLNQKYLDEYRGLGAPRGFIRPYRGVRTRTHTYVEDRAGPWLLYDDERDPYQMSNLVASGDASAVPPELERELQGWLESTGDLFEDTDYYINLIDLETGLCTNPERLTRG